MKTDDVDFNDQRINHLIDLADSDLFISENEREALRWAIAKLRPSDRTARSPRGTGKHDAPSHWPSWGGHVVRHP